MSKKKVNANQALTMIIVAILIIGIGKQVIKMNTTITLLLSATTLCILALIWGVKWDDIQEEMKNGIKIMAVPVIILMCVGILVGAWMLSGTIPTMIYYGMKILKPSFFLFMACIICVIMSVMTGTSWGTIATVGVALIGISTGLGIPIKYTAGAIVVGAVFGDKLSPLSDTTVMASAVSGVEITDHIKHMLYTTVPGLIISLVLYLIIGAKYGSGIIGGVEYISILTTLESTFNISPLLLIPPILVLILIFKKQPTTPTFAVGILAGGILAMLFQGTNLSELTNVFVKGYTQTTNVAIVDKLIIRGGLNSMNETITLVIAAGLFGAPLKASGAMEAILQKIELFTKTKKQMMTSMTFIHPIFLIITVSYYVSFAIIGNMAQGLYDKYGLHKKNLSRTLEDTGTALAPLIPWGPSGAYIASNLGVSVGEYWKYAPLTYLSIAFGLFCIATGFGIAKADGTMKKSFFRKNRKYKVKR